MIVTLKGTEVIKNFLLAPLTTIGVGGLAKYFVKAKSKSELLRALESARINHLPIFILGSGSNVIISDQGWPGMVIKSALLGLKIASVDDKTVHATVAAGESWDAFVRYCVERNWGGVECLAGIPGTVGATPIQNVGAYGQEVADTIVSVQAMNISNGNILHLSKSDCNFGYRTSIFNDEHFQQSIILCVKFALHIGSVPSVKYADLSQP